MQGVGATLLYLPFVCAAALIASWLGIVLIRALHQCACLLVAVLVGYQIEGFSLCSFYWRNEGGRWTRKRDSALFVENWRSISVVKDDRWRYLTYLLGGPLLGFFFSLAIGLPLGKHYSEWVLAAGGACLYSFIIEQEAELAAITKFFRGEENLSYLALATQLENLISEQPDAEPGAVFVQFEELYALAVTPEEKLYASGWYANNLIDEGYAEESLGWLRRSIDHAESLAGEDEDYAETLLSHTASLCTIELLLDRVRPLFRIRYSRFQRSRRACFRLPPPCMNTVGRMLLRLSRFAKTKPLGMMY